MTPIKKITARLEYKFLPLTIGIETLGGIFTPLILRGTPLPASRHQPFSTATDNQETVEINIYIGERPIANHNPKLATFTLKGLPRKPKGILEINVHIQVNTDLSIQAEALEMESGAKVSLQCDKSDIDLTREMIQKILREAEANRTEDQHELRSREEENEVQSVIYKAQSVLGDKHKKPYNSKKIEERLAELGLAIENGEQEQARLKAKELESLLATVAYSSFDDIFSDFFSFPVGKKRNCQNRLRRPHTSP